MDEYDDDERCSEDEERHQGERRDYAQEQGGRGDGCVQAGGLNANTGPPCWHEVVIKTMLHPVDGRCGGTGPNYSMSELHFDMGCVPPYITSLPSHIAAEPSFCPRPT